MNECASKQKEFSEQLNNYANRMLIRCDICEVPKCGMVAAKRERGLYNPDVYCGRSIPEDEVPAAFSIEKV